jgi:hypothetical protein
MTCAGIQINHGGYGVGAHRFIAILDKEIAVMATVAWADMIKEVATGSLAARARREVWRGTTQ